ncbi:preprotein translocase subunit SecA [Candidatus Uhrbacteria bacterium]|nr:preprotein translocase subunit SecA [Candidatus Uhrbacteria bacterium]
MSFFTKIFGDPNTRVINSLMPFVAQVNTFEAHVSGLSDDELKGKTVFFRERLGREESLDALLPEAFAVCREVSRRVLKQRHYDVQVIGASVLHRGQIAEMRTGEGKTLTATLAVYLNALIGKGVHVVTVNDYLAMRDSVWMGKLYHALGLSISSIQHEAAYLYDPHYHSSQEEEKKDIQEETEEGSETQNFRIQHDFLRPCSRKEAYLADITYGTNNEFGFDYLRDNLVSDLDRMVQRPLHFAIIDEARTPLIISGPAGESSGLYTTFAQVVSRLTENEDYNIDEKLRAATLTDTGFQKVENMLGMKDMYTTANISTLHHIEQALKARALFKRDKDYVVKENEVIIVDEFTGRLMHGRRYSEGLHQAIEAKEGVKIQRESQTYATVTFQNYFRLYKKLSGMTGTAATEAEEFAKIYKLEVVTIPTNKPMIRKDHQDRIYISEKGKYAAVVEEIRQCHERGQPVLVGTISIERNEYLSALLEREGVPHKLLNAKNHEKEAETIAQAGKAGAVTIATNMAGRGVDIILGGNPADADDARAVRECGGLYVIGTERHESRRIDNQLRGRSGRQGDPGMSLFFISLEDDLMRIFGSERMKGMLGKLGAPEDMPIENSFITKCIEEAQRKVESHHFDTRKHLLEYDDVMNKQREMIYKRRRDILAEFERETNEDGDIVIPSDPPTGGENPDDSEKDEIATVASLPRNDSVTLREMVLTMIEEEIEHVVTFHTTREEDQAREWNIQEIYETMHTIFPVSQSDRKGLTDIYETGDRILTEPEKRTHIISYLCHLARQSFTALETHVAENMKKQGIPMTSHVAMAYIEKDLLIRCIDTLWIEHLEAIDHLRTGIGLRGYGQHDPLVEYKREAFRLFSELLSLIHRQVVYSIFKIGAFSDQVVESSKKLTYSAPAKDASGGSASASSHSSGGAKVGRNDPCPCASGKKYKRCHGA